AMLGGSVASALEDGETKRSNTAATIGPMLARAHERRLSRALRKNRIVALAPAAFIHSFQRGLSTHYPLPQCAPSPPFQWAELGPEYRLDLVSIMQRGAGICDNKVSFLNAVSHLDVGVGEEAKPNVARHHSGIAHDLDRRPFRPIFHGGPGNRNTTAVAG